MKTILVSVDIEKAGCLIAKHPVISVGFSVGDTNGRLFSQRKFNVSVNWFQKDSEGNVTNYGDFEKRCVDEFWSKLPQSTIEKCLTNPEPLPAESAWIAIGAWIDFLEELYPIGEYEIKFVSDNPSFDIGNIDYCLERYAGRIPMRYTSKGKYRSIVTSDDMLYMLPTKALVEAKERIDNQVTHDHDCVNDSYNIMLQYVEVLRYMKSTV
jgi:hypothetical protein